MSCMILLFNLKYNFTEGTTREMAYKSILFSVFWALVVDIYAYQHYTIYIIATAAVIGGDVNELENNLS